MPESKSSLLRFLKLTLAVLGGTIGAIFGAVVGARSSVEIGQDLFEEDLLEKQDVLKKNVTNGSATDTSAEPSVQNRPFTPELRFPPRPAPDWTDSKPASLPKPTYAPVSVAFGLMLGAAGVVTSFWVSVAGLIVFTLGLANWIGGLVHEQH